MHIHTHIYTRVFTYMCAHTHRHRELRISEQYQYTNNLPMKSIQTQRPWYHDHGISLLLMYNLLVLIASGRKMIYTETILVLY